MLDNVPRFVAPQVLQLPVPGSSVFLLLDRRVTVVDAGPVGSAGRVLRALRLLGRAADEVEQIVITHYHPDHVGGLAGLQRHLPARTGVHAVEAPVVRGDLPPPLPVDHLLLRRPVRLLGRRLLPPARVDTLLRDGDELPVLGGLRVVHLPGHTPGHIALHLPERGVLIAGDALQVRQGRLIPPARLASEDWEEAVRSLRRLTGLDFAVLALSHFPPWQGDARVELERLAGLAEA
jgi:glyoxylase-like metal-dependent hydrolase (beta-lactamase superfamily II)